MSSSTIDMTNLPGKAFELGSPVAEFRAAPDRPWVPIVFLVIVGLFFATVGALVFLNTAHPIWVVMIFGLALLAVAGWQIYSVIHNRDLRVVVFEKGFVCVRGGKKHVVPWDEITGVYQHNVNVYYRNALMYTSHGTSHTYTVWTEDRTHLVLNDKIANIEALGTMIQKQATESLLPDYLSDYEDGERLGFNLLRLSKEGISKSGQLLPWDQVESVGLARGVIIVRRLGAKANWATQSVAMTPNLFVFLHIVYQVAGVRRMDGA